MFTRGLTGLDDPGGLTWFVRCDEKEEDGRATVDEGSLLSTGLEEVGEVEVVCSGCECFIMMRLDEGLR